MIIFELFFHIFIVIINAIGIKTILADLKVNKHKIKRYTRDKNIHTYLLKYIWTYIIPTLILFILIWQINSSIAEFPFLDNSLLTILLISLIMLLVLLIFSAFDMDTINEKFKISNSIEEKFARLCNNNGSRRILYFLVVAICIFSRYYFLKGVENVKTFTYEMEKYAEIEKEEDENLKKQISETLDKLIKTLDNTNRLLDKIE